VKTSNENYYIKYLETKHQFDNVNQTLKSIIKNKEELSKEEIIELLEECTAYFC
jgi:hypothetical protein